MQNVALELSPSRQDKLQNYVVGFWAQDEWDMSECPLVASDNPSSLVIRFLSVSPSLNREVKFACRKKFESRKWSTHSGALAHQLREVFQFLNRKADNIVSLLEKRVEYWESAMTSYLMEQGTWKESSVVRPDANQKLRRYTGIDPRVSVLRQIYLTLEDAFDERPEYDKDVWDLLKLGASPSKSRSANKLNFASISQSWLRQAAKQFVRYSLSIHSASSCQSKLQSICILSDFLSQKHPNIRPPEVSRAVLVEFLAHLASSGLKESTRSVYIIQVRGFLELCVQEHWLDIPDGRLLDPRDIPQEKNTQPRFIPQDVLEQLNRHIELLPPEFMRMILIIQECGMRVDELLNMPFDCLIQDATGDWFLRYFQGKMKKEHSIPISREITAIFQEQQQIVQKASQQTTGLLFPNPKGKPFKYGTFLLHLNRLAYEQRISDSSGQLWHFELHQFRHTVGTRMINNGVPQPIIQRYLGHASPEMTNRYAFIQDQTMKEEFAKYRGKIVNIVGKVVEEDPIVDVADLQWMKKNILAQALPNGYCGLPLVAGPCPHANACLTCTHFRTDTTFLSKHREQLVATEQILEAARANNWHRVIEMNEQVKANLSQIIIALEPTTNDA